MKLVLKILFFCGILSACDKKTSEPQPSITEKPKPDTVKVAPTINTIAPKKLHVVAMGSSTISGVGPLSQDSTIMNRIKKWLTDQIPLAMVTNLGVGGMTTFQGLPIAQPGPAGYPKPDETLNTDAVLKQKPDIVIISFPSNDFLLNINAAMVEQNFNTIYNAVDSKNVKVIFLGIQPRNLNPAQIAMQKEVDGYLKAKFGDRYVRVYNHLSNADGSIKSLYSAGDGTHLNNAGHRILFESMLAQCAGLFLN